MQERQTRPSRSFEATGPLEGLTGSTHSGIVPPAPAGQAPVWEMGAWVRVQQLPASCDAESCDAESGDAHAAAPKDIGIGRLLERLMPGARLRVGFGAAASQVMLSTPVLEVEALGPKVVRVATDNHAYQLSRLNGERPRPKDALGRLADLRARTRPVATARAKGDDDATGLVDSAAAPRPAAAAGAFAAGARVRVTKVSSRERDLESRRELGLGHLLDALEIGSCARFSVDEGPTVATSPIRGVQRLGARALLVVTANTSYRFERVDSAETS